MSSPLKGGIAKQVAKALKRAKLLLPATLIKFTPGTRTPDHLSEGTNPTTANYAARGFVVDDKYEKIGGTLVEKNDRIIALAAAPIASKQVPATKDRITLDGVTTRVMGVETDPAKAIYICLTRA